MARAFEAHLECSGRYRQGDRAERYLGGGALLGRLGPHQPAHGPGAAPSGPVLPHLRGLQDPH